MSFLLLLLLSLLLLCDVGRLISRQIIELLLAVASLCLFCFLRLVSSILHLLLFLCLTRRFLLLDVSSVACVQAVILSNININIIFSMTAHFIYIYIYELKKYNFV